MEERKKDRPSRGTRLNEAQRFRTAWDMSSAKQWSQRHLEDQGQGIPESKLHFPIRGTGKHLGLEPLEVTCIPGLPVSVSTFWVAHGTSPLRIDWLVLLGNPENIMASWLQSGPFLHLLAVLSSLLALFFQPSFSPSDDRDGQ